MRVNFPPILNDSSAILDHSHSRTNDSTASARSTAHSVSVGRYYFIAGGRAGGAVASIEGSGRSASAPASGPLLTSVTFVTAGLPP